MDKLQHSWTIGIAAIGKPYECPSGMVQNLTREAARLAERFLQRQARQAVASLSQVPFGRYVFA